MRAVCLDGRGFCILALILVGVASCLAQEGDGVVERSKYPLEKVVAVEGEDEEWVLHREDFSEDTLYRIWGTLSENTEIADGVMKLRRDEPGRGKLKVSVEPFVDAEFTFRFQLVDGTALSIGWDDMTAKRVTHAGHLGRVTIGTREIRMVDSRTGIYDMKHYHAYREGKVTPELEALFARCEKSVPSMVETGKWYEARVRLAGDEAVLWLDGEEVMRFRSPGFAHPRKDMYRFRVIGEEVELDDVLVVGG